MYIYVKLRRDRTIHGVSESSTHLTIHKDKIDFPRLIEEEPIDAFLSIIDLFRIRTANRRKEDFSKGNPPLVVTISLRFAVRMCCDWLTYKDNFIVLEEFRENLAIQSVVFRGHDTSETAGLI